MNGAGEGNRIGFRIHPMRREYKHSPSQAFRRRIYKYFVIDSILRSDHAPIRQYACTPIGIPEKLRGIEMQRIAAHIRNKTRSGIMIADRERLKCKFLRGVGKYTARILSETGNMKSKLP